ncbi:MAG: TetR/AcrR family transcriptional regulator [Clostridiales bacterium]|nr:TetR/AcrR family transcriptional regulator [Clostridiales bacterium]
MKQENQSTKQLILAEALTLFSTKGYESVTVAEIANAVGVKAPALYKHYKSKQDIFNAILEEMKASYDRQAAAMQMDGRDAEKDQSLYIDTSENATVKRSMELFLYFLHDDNERKFRKVLAIEQYNNRDLADVYANQYVDFPLSYQSALFGLMVNLGVTIPENPQIMALQYYAPVYLYLRLCDCQPEREAEALQILEQHFKQFIRVYHKEETR